MPKRLAPRLTDGPEAAYHARYQGRPGYLATVDRAMMFLDVTTDEPLVVTPPMVNALETLWRLTPEAAGALRRQLRGQHGYLDVQMGN